MSSDLNSTPVRLAFAGWRYRWIGATLNRERDVAGLPHFHGCKPMAAHGPVGIASVAPGMRTASHYALPFRPIVLG
jgi:hypothetical protein